MNAIVPYSVSTLNASTFCSNAMQMKMIDSLARGQNRRACAPSYFVSLKIELVMARDDYYLLILTHVVKLRERIVP